MEGIKETKLFISTQTYKTQALQTQICSSACTHGKHLTCLDPRQFTESELLKSPLLMKCFNSPLLLAILNSHHVATATDTQTATLFWAASKLLALL